jgi:hypothetical protein
MPFCFLRAGIPAEVVGRPFQAVDSLSSGSGGLKAGLRARLPAPQFVQNSASGENYVAL